MTTRSVDRSRWLRRFHPTPNPCARLVCLPHAGGSASYYFPVSTALSPGIEVLAVQYPGRQDRRREPFVERITDLADHVVAAVEGYTDRPLALFGHSMGAAVAFEVAARLEARGIEPAEVFVSGRRAPSTYRRETTHLLPDAGLLADVRDLSGTDDGVFGDHELLSLVLPAIRNDYTAIETYQWTGGGKITSPIQALVGDADTKATLDEVSAWAAHTSGEFHLRVYRGGHFYLNQHAPAVLGLIGARLRAAASTQVGSARVA